MFVGHTAVALAPKSRAPRSSLGVFVAAAVACDLLWPKLLLFGIERAHIAPGITRFVPLALDYTRWSVVFWIVPLWAGWADRHRVPREAV
jgi:hypothetical protein